MDKIVEILKEALKHSIAQAFLIFSGVFILFSIKYHTEGNIFLISFLTLFYAMVAHYLTTLRKHESLGRYAVGSDHRQIIRFTTIYISWFLWWAIGIGGIILLSWDSAHVLFKFFSNNVDLLGMLLVAGTAIFSVPFIMTMIWFFRMFNNKTKTEANLPKNYKLQLFCKHCGFGDGVKITIPTKRPIGDHPCPRCGTYKLERERGGVETRGMQY